MRSILAVGLAFAALALVVGAPVRSVRAEGDEEKCPLDKLPAKVTAAVKAKWPKGEMVSATKETESGKTTYEVKLKDGDSVIEAIVTEDGTITEVEATIAVKDLPKAVTDAIAAKYPKSTLDRAESLTKGDKTTYEVRLTTAEKKGMEVTVGADGKILEEEEAGGGGDEGMGGDKK